jgi:hypothetical protein
MATRTKKLCNKNQWTEVATGVTAATIYKHSSVHDSDNKTGTLFQYQVPTGGGAPSETDLGYMMGKTLDIESAVSIDVYIYAKDAAANVMVE